MNIPKVSAPVAFCAKTTVYAPETMLRKEDADYFVARGNDLGTQEDIINISVGEKYLNVNNPEEDLYSLTIRSKFGGIKEKISATIPTDVITPKKYIEKWFKAKEADDKKFCRTVY